MSGMRQVRLVALILGFMTLFVADRYLSAETYWVATRASGLVLIGVALAIAIATWQRAEAAVRIAHRIIVTCQVALTTGAVVYILYMRWLGPAGLPDTLARKAVLGAWLVLLVLGSIALAGAEMAIGVDARQIGEPERVRRAAQSWLKVAMVAVTLFALNFIASELNKSADLSFARTSAVSEATRKIVADLKQPLEVAVFFRYDNDVRQPALDYISQLPGLNVQVTVREFDKDLNPTEAEQHKVGDNGVIAFRYGENIDKISLGSTLQSARSVLQEMDARVQKTILAVSSTPKVIYVSAGHGEFATNSSDPKTSSQVLGELARNLNMTVKNWGLEQGSTDSVPQDAAAVVIVGPQRAFMESETKALSEWLNGGGSIFVALDLPSLQESAETPTSGPRPLVEWLGKYGVKYESAPLAHDRKFARATRTDIDHWFIFTNDFTSHESVSALARADERMAFLAFRSGALSFTQPEPQGWKHAEAIRSLSDGFLDMNQNFAFDAPAERRQRYALATVGTYTLPQDPALKKTARLAVLANATAISDALLGNIGNVTYLASTFRWLVGDAQHIASLASEQDIKIQHTNKEDVVFFYGTVLGVPGLVLMLGAAVTRRKGSRRKKSGGA